MSYIGNEPPNIGAYGVESFNGGGTSFTLSKAAETATVLLFIDGVRQTPVDAYSVSGTTLTTTATTPSGTDNVTVQFLGDVVDFGTPSDNSVTTAKIVDDAVTVDKLANSINTEITANTAKVTNATHTGDVTGATALTIASGAVDLAMLSATGTASSSTFLRGDNAWASAGGNNTPAFMAVSSGQQSCAHNAWIVIACPTEIYDSDSAYDTSTYKFTVPVGEQGVYVFSHTNGIQSITSSAELIFGFGSDNAAAFGKSSGATSEGFASGTAFRTVTAIANLDAGDEVWATVVQGTGSTQNTANVAAFSGFKLIGSPF